MLFCFGLEKKRNTWSECDLFNEHVREKTNNLGFRPGPTLTGLCSHRRLEILVLDSRGIVLSVYLICAFVSAYVDCWFSHASAQMIIQAHALRLSQ